MENPYHIFTLYNIKSSILPLVGTLWQRQSHDKTLKRLAHFLHIHYQT